MINEVKQSLGAWNLVLRDDTPKELLDALEPFGHIAVVPGRVDVRSAADGLLAAARYVGVYRGRSDGDIFSMRGCGMEMWLGDEDDKGDIFVNTVTVASGTTFANTIRALVDSRAEVDHEANFLPSRDRYLHQPIGAGRACIEPQCSCRQPQLQLPHRLVR